MNARRLWLVYALVTTVFWGVWGALIEIPEKAGFPAPLGYAVWSLTMVPCALGALHRGRWKLDRDRRSVTLGSTVGLLGAGGQILLFQALRDGPAYLVFPFISLYPVVTVFLSVTLLKERGQRRTCAGVILALLAMPLLAYQPPAGAATKSAMWVLLAVVVFVAWGVQAFFMRFANRSMTAESVFFYMAVTAVLLSPLAIAMTDLSQPINWGFRGPWLAALIQVLNSIGALTLVYALRHGRALVVVPMTALAPVLTIACSLALYRTVPQPIVVAGMVLALVAVYLLAE